MKDSRTGVKNVLPRTFSITGKQQRYQSRIGSWQKDPGTIMKSHERTIWASKNDQTDGNTLNASQIHEFILPKKGKAKNKTAKGQKATEEKTLSSPMEIAHQFLTLKTDNWRERTAHLSGFFWTNSFRLTMMLLKCSSLKEKIETKEQGGRQHTRNKSDKCRTSDLVCSRNQWQNTVEVAERSKEYSRSKGT